MSKTVTMESLKAMGYKVFLKHEERKSGGFITKVAIHDLKMEKIYYANAMSHPNDQFCRKIGRNIALGRAFNPRSQEIIDVEGENEETIKAAIKRLVYIPSEG